MEHLMLGGSVALIPFCVDLDGTLVFSDVLFESPRPAPEEQATLYIAHSLVGTSGAVCAEGQGDGASVLGSAETAVRPDFISWIKSERRSGRQYGYALGLTSGWHPELRDTSACLTGYWPAIEAVI
jgi:hypothetical protein